MQRVEKKGFRGIGILLLLVIVMIIFFGIFINSKKELSYTTSETNSTDLVFFWHNQKTGESEPFKDMPPQDRLKEFLPQIPAAQNLYDLYIMKGETPEESFQKVLKASLGIQE